MNKKKKNIYIYIYILLHMSYRAQTKPKVVVHYSCGAKLFDFGSTNIGIILYLIALKMVI